MRERPVIFSGPMVRAILEGRKTQTRRVLAKQPLDVIACKGEKEGHEWIALLQQQPEARGTMFRCRYGVPGDRLWVRETCAFIWPGEVQVPRSECKIEYRADTGAVLPGGWPEENRADPDCPRWVPAIHMPRSACRLVLEIVNVRVQRLQQISEADARAEGARYFPSIPIGTPHKYSPPTRWSMEELPPNTDHCLSSAKYAFANFWNKLNEKRGHGWDKNPWVWAVEFKRRAP